MKLLTKIVASIMFMAVLMGTFTNVVIETAFYLQQDYIARVKCENRTKPMAHCDGKCYLRKQLQKEEKKETQGFNLEKLELVWMPTSNKMNTVLPTITNIGFTDSYTAQLLPGHMQAPYHPPTFMI